MSAVLPEAGPRVVAPRRPALYDTETRHVRAGRGPSYRLRHRTYMWLVDLAELPRPPGPLRLLAGFDARDHFGGGLPTIRAGLDAFLAARGAALPPDSRVLMLAHARVFGYVFNPLSVYWCHAPDGRLLHVVAEVHNTYGGRHVYLLGPEVAQSGGRTAKEFHVSPFFGVDGDYLMRLPVPDERISLSVRLSGTADGARLTATVSGGRRPATAPGLLRAALRHPWSTVGVAVGIRFHGVRLWLRGLAVRPCPPHVPQEGVK
ncbi:DUF1365 domain-containing protein [Streptomyces sp. NPDC088097]|uniref:DUF1365 domain-containing protein n=1 Tax=Streptomyces sp. NPDC088097 TaxID=3365823 RepID=UPI00380B05BC